MSTQHVQYMLLFLVLVVNSDQFQILHALTLSARSYVLLTNAIAILYTTHIITVHYCLQGNIWATGLIQNMIRP